MMAKETKPMAKPASLRWRSERKRDVGSADSDMLLSEVDCVIPASAKRV